MDSNLQVLEVEPKFSIFIALQPDGGICAYIGLYNLIHSKNHSAEAGKARQ